MKTRTLILLSSIVFCASAHATPSQLVKIELRPNAGAVVTQSDLNEAAAEELHDYGQLIVLRLPSVAAPHAIEHFRARGFTIIRRDEWDTVHAPSGRRFDTRGLASLQAPAPDTRGLYLFQFAAPLAPEWQDEIESAGIDIIQYVPNNAAIVVCSRAAAASLARRSWVQWVDVYEQSYKNTPRSAPSSRISYAVELAAVPEAEATISRLSHGSKIETATLGHSTYIQVSLTKDEVAALAADAFVISIEAAPVTRVSGERESIALLGTSNGANEPFQNFIEPILNNGRYVDWLHHTLTYNPGPYATSELADTHNYKVAFVDMGLDTGVDGFLSNSHARHDYLQHLGFQSPGYPSLEFTDYGDVPGDTYENLHGGDIRGHGTMTVGILAAYNSEPPSPDNVDGAGFRYGSGIAPFTSIYVQRAIAFSEQRWLDTSFHGTLSTNVATRYQQLVNDAINVSATVQNYSLNDYVDETGVQPNGAYNTSARVMDQLLSIDAAPNRDFTVTVAAGNASDAAASMVLPLGTAKNVITVGSSESFVPGQLATAPAIDQCNNAPLIRDPHEFVANGLMNIAWHSRRATLDGRYKPDIVAPGTMVSSLKTLGGQPLGSMCYSPGEPYSSPFLKWYLDSGTSFAAPQAAGAAVLLNKMMTPLRLRSSFLKAALVGNAVSLRGGLDRRTGLNISGRPNSVQGYGRVNVGETMNHRDQQYTQSTCNMSATGASQTISMVVSDPSRPVVIALAWTDQAAAANQGSMPTLVNDLDLVVTSGSSKYYGNVMSNDVSTEIVGVVPPDELNNVELVVIPAGHGTTFTLQVLAARVNGRTDYGLFVSNATNPSGVFETSGSFSCPVFDY